MKNNSLKHIRAHMRDIEEQYREKERQFLDSHIVTDEHGEEVFHSGVSVGEMIAVELAAKGRYAINMGGERPCEMDYMASMGKQFPKVEQEAAMLFNKMTMKPVMEEKDLQERYEKMIVFFRYNSQSDLSQADFVKRAIA